MQLLLLSDAEMCRSIEVVLHDISQLLTEELFVQMSSFKTNFKTQSHFLMCFSVKHGSRDLCTCATFAT